MMPNLLNPAAPPPPQPVAPPPAMPPLGTVFAGPAVVQALASPPPSTPGASAPILAPVLPGNVVAMPPVPPAAATEADPDDKFTEADLIEQYIGLRDEKKRREAAHKEQMQAQFDQRMDKIERTVRARMERGGVTSFKAPTGTAFTKTVTRYSLSDSDEFLAWVAQNNRDDMLKRDIRQDPVREFAEQTGTLPPGVQVYSEIVTQFRK